MMGFLSKKILFLSYGIVACAMISCSVFGSDLSEDDSLLPPLEELVSDPPHFPRLVEVVAHESDITKLTIRIESNEFKIQALTTHFETQISELTAKYDTQLQALTTRFESRDTTSVEHPVAAPRIAIPKIARGNEEIYERFLRGSLIYRPTGSDVGKIELPIADFLTQGQNPFESTFDLSKCGNAAMYLSISTGYRRAVKPENSNKWEVFITPKFLIEAHKTTTAAHYTNISNATWSAPFAVIQNYGGWNNLGDYSYHVTLSDIDLNSKNLYEIPSVMERGSVQTLSASRLPFQWRTEESVVSAKRFIFNFVG